MTILQKLKIRHNDSQNFVVLDQNKNKSDVLTKVWKEAHSFEQKQEVIPTIIRRRQEFQGLLRRLIKILNRRIAITTRVWDSSNFRSP